MFMNKHINAVRRLVSLESLLHGREYWFFQTRDSFLKQDRMMKWDPNRLDQYIILPIDWGFVNQQDCFFVSHFWRERHHPDPDGIDLRLFYETLKAPNYSYVWLDWTCMPQVPRTPTEQHYFNRMLRCIPMLVRDCGFAWRFPRFEPRAWVLFEVAEYMLNHKEFWFTDDIQPFVSHVMEMVKMREVQPILEKYKYRCTTMGDMRLVTGWLEILIILYLEVRDAGHRQSVLNYTNWATTGTYWNTELDLKIDKVNGIVTVGGKTYNFTPVFHLTSGAIRTTENSE